MVSTVSNCVEWILGGQCRDVDSVGVCWVTVWIFFKIKFVLGASFVSTSQAHDSNQNIRRRSLTHFIPQF